MRTFLIASLTGIFLGAIATPYLAGPLLAQNTEQAKTYQQLELFGNLFDRIRAEYVEEVDDEKLIEAAIIYCCSFVNLAYASSSILHMVNNLVLENQLPTNH